MKVKFGEVEVDLGAAVPLTVGDLYLLKQEGATQSELMKNPMEVDTVRKFLLYMARKVNRSITEKDIDALPAEQMGPVLLYLVLGKEPGKEGVDRPT